MSDFDMPITNNEILIPAWGDDEELAKPVIDEGIHLAALTRIELNVSKNLKPSKEGRMGHAVGYQCEFTILNGDAKGNTIRYYAFVGRKDPKNGELFDTQSGRSFKALVTALGATPTELPSAWEGGYFQLVPDLLWRKVFIVVAHKQEVRYDVRDLDADELTADDMVLTAQITRIRSFTNKGEKANYIPFGKDAELPEF